MLRLRLTLLDACPPVGRGGVCVDEAPWTEAWMGLFPRSPVEGGHPWSRAARGASSRVGSERRTPPVRRGRRRRRRRHGRRRRRRHGVEASTTGVDGLTETLSLFPRGSCSSRCFNMVAVRVAAAFMDCVPPHLSRHAWLGRRFGRRLGPTAWIDPPCMLAFRTGARDERATTAPKLRVHPSQPSEKAAFREGCRPLRAWRLSKQP